MFYILHDTIGLTATQYLETTQYTVLKLKDSPKMQQYHNIVGAH